MDNRSWSDLLCKSILFFKGCSMTRKRSHHRCCLQAFGKRLLLLQADQMLIRRTVLKYPQNCSVQNLVGQKMLLVYLVASTQLRIYSSEHTPSLGSASRNTSNQTSSLFQTTHRQKLARCFSAWRGEWWRICKYRSRWIGTSVPNPSQIHGTHHQVCKIVHGVAGGSGPSWAMFPCSHEG